MVAARIIGETFDAERALGVAGSGLGDELCSWEASAPDSAGLLDLPDWLTYRCATAETSSRTGAATVRTGFPSHAPRGYSEDGSTWGLLLEPAATNLATERDFSDWTPSGTPVLASVTTPAGASEVCSVQDDDGAATEFIADNDRLASGLSLHTLSAWVRNFAAIDAALKTKESGVSDLAVIQWSGVDSAWAPKSDTYTGAATSSASEIYAMPAVTAADTGTTYFWGIQVEAGRSYPTSFMGADGATFTRAAGKLTAPSSEITMGGHFDVEIEFAPQFANDEPSGDCVLLHIDADSSVFYRAADDKACLKLAGTVVATSSALTFARGDVLTIRAQHRPDKAAVVVSGASAGNGTTEVAAEPPLEMPTTLVVCGDSSGVTEGLVLQAVTVYQPIAGLLRLPGWMWGHPISVARGSVEALQVWTGQTVRIAAAAVAPDGWLGVTLTWRPAHADTVSATLLQLDYATLVYDHVSGTIKWTVDDGIVAAQELESGAVSFSAYDTLVVEIEHSERRRRLVVDGDAVSADPLPALVLPSIGYVLSVPAGAAVDGELVSFVPDLQTFAQLADDRVLVQMGPNFRLLVQELVQDRARTYDALLGIRAALDIEHAVGEQLDAIGSVVGLAREGFTDDRYQVFLGIQIELLLAAAREDNEWTGTCKNILRICRRFVGEAAPTIKLRNAPPYSYALTIEDLDFNEAWLLVRFLRTASHHAVLGLIALTLADDSLWAHDTISVPGAGVWDHETVAITGAVVWGVAATTE